MQMWAHDGYEYGHVLHANAKCKYGAMMTAGLHQEQWAAQLVI